MSTRCYDFVQLDVFTRTPLTGNALAVFTDARGLKDGEMQALAREMNLSETTFVLPREPEIEAREGIKVRIFTVNEELPFAGHPTLGTALLLYSSGRASDQIILDLKLGKILVRFREEPPNASRDRVNGDVFAEMRQRDPEFGPNLAREKVASVLGVENDEIVSEWPVQVVSTGLPFAIVPFRKTEVLARLKCNFVQPTAALEGSGARFFYFICPRFGGNQLEVNARMFFYGGEDPATGSAAGCAAAWLVKYGIAKSDQQVLIRQGVEMGRPSEIFVRGTLNGDQVTNVCVGGYAVEVLRGQVSFY